MPNRISLITASNPHARACLCRIGMTLLIRTSRSCFVSSNVDETKKRMTRSFSSMLNHLGRDSSAQMSPRKLWIMTAEGLRIGDEQTLEGRSDASNSSFVSISEVSGKAAEGAGGAAWMDECDGCG